MKKSRIDAVILTAISTEHGTHPQNYSSQVYACIDARIDRKQE
jgi:hypothetical protein